ncbi:hypothetical protein N7G274_002077 [Stereocaulon virgatum]|uniref:Translation machinery-associated protein 16 n=1 Tax=Stereocaulon virgatum TaxID=373712 RepID=A0ABR4ALU2_9LECA
MPKSLAKVQKKLSKKKGKISSLHENSRDAQKLRRAGARGEKLERLAAARAKANQPHMQRVAYFQGAAKAAMGPIEPQRIHGLIQRYLARHDEELAELKSQRRPGRPTSTREDLLKQSIAVEDREYDAGFWIPDMQDEDNLAILKAWNGEWTALNTFKYIRLSRDGSLQQSNFPPKGLS